MTIASTTTSIQPLANGVATQFNFGNKIFAAADLVVTLIDTQGNQYAFVNQANATLGLSYTVQNVDVDSGCFIVFSAAPPNGWTVDVRSVTPQLQSTSIKNQGDFLPELHEEAFDRVTREMQDLLRRSYTFGIHAPDIESVPWQSMPSVAARKGLALMFDPVTGQPTVGVPSTQTITGGLIASLFQGQTPNELALGVVPTNYFYPACNAFRYGAVGNGVVDDTAAIQTATNVAQLSSNPAVYGSNSPASGTPVVTISSGFYKVTSPITFSNPVAFEGEGGPEYSMGSRIYMASQNTDLFVGTPTTSGSSVSFRRLSIRSTNTGTGRLLWLKKNVGTFNSARIIDCVFGQPQAGAIQFDAGDDLELTNVVFDVATSATGFGLSLGTTVAGEVATNVRLNNCNWFLMQKQCIKVQRLSGLVTSGCIMYTDGSTRTEHFFDASAALQCDDVVLGPMKGTYGRCLAALNNANGITISGITWTLGGIGAGEALSMIRTFGTCDRLTVTGLQAKGQYDTKSFYDDSGATAVTNANIQGNTFVNGGGTGPATVCSKTTGQIRNNRYNGFIQPSVGAPWTTSGSAFNPGNLTSGSVAGAAITVNGAQPGDRLEITAIADWPVSQLLTLIPKVAAANVATIVYGNPTGGTINITAHDFQIEVQR